MKRKKKKKSRIYLILLGTFLDQLTAFFLRKNIYHIYGKLDKVKYITRELTFETIKGYNPFREIGIKFFLE